jgi:hypothetical protein
MVISSICPWPSINLPETFWLKEVVTVNSHKKRNVTERLIKEIERSSSKLTILPHNRCRKGENNYHGIPVLLS